MHRLTSLILAGLVIAVVSGLKTSAQTINVSNINLVNAPVPGSGHDYIQLLNETVDPANGSVSLRIEAPVPKQRGDVNYPYYVFGYDSSGVSLPTGNIYWAGAGGALSPNLVISWTNNSVITGSTPSAPGLIPGGFVANAAVGQLFVQSVDLFTSFISDPFAGVYYTATCNYDTGFVFVDGQATRHTFGGAQWITLNGNGTSSDGGCNVYNVNRYPNGGDAHYQMQLTQIGQNLFPYNTYWTDSHGRGSGTLGFEDTNGNCCGPVGTKTIANGQVTSVSIPGLANPYYFTYGSATRNYTPSAALVYASLGTGCPLGLSSSSYQPTVLQTISLPNSTASNPQQYVFGYDPTYGLLNKITYPTGATVTYSWAVNPMSESLGLGPLSYHCNYEHDWPYVQRRTVSFDGVHPALMQTFQYSTTWGTGNQNDPWSQQWTQKTTTVTTQDLLRPGQPSFQTQYTYSSFAVTEPITGTFEGQTAIETSIVYKDWNGSVLKTVTKNWQNNVPPLLLSECTTLPPSAGGATSGVFYTYGRLGVVTDKAEYDYGIISSSACAQGASPPTAAPTRETVITYASFPDTPLYPTGPSMLDRSSSVKIYANGQKSGSLVAETDYAYDNYGPSGIASVPSNTVGHDETNFPPSYTNRGNVTSKIQCLVGSTECGNNVVTTYTFDETGQILSMVDPNGNAPGGNPAQHTTTYSFADNWVSGDTYTSSVSASGTLNAYLTKITYPPTNGVSHIETFSYDSPSGQLTVSNDENGRTTTYRYDDAFARLTKATYPDSGQTAYSYNDSPFSSSNNTPSVTKTQTISSSVSTVTTASDGLGHTVRTILSSDPDGTDYTDTSYDGFGRVLQQSNPYRPGSPSGTDGNTTHTYDALGRTTVVQKQDGSVVSTVYDQTSPNTGGTCTTVTDEVGNPRKSCTDGLGRLVEVDEPGTGAKVGTLATATVTITGGPVQSITINPCQNNQPPAPTSCPQTITDGGSINVNVNGFVVSGGYGQGSTTQSIASAIATALNSSTSPVTASLSGSTITITTEYVGAPSGYSLSVTANWNTQYFSGPSFTATTSGSLAGGSNSSLGTPLVTLYNYNVLGDLLCVWQKGTDTTSATFNGSNCLSAASATWRPRFFIYDSLSRLTSATNPESGTISYQYDANGNVSSKTAPMPNKIPADTSLPQTVTTNYTYDNLNRVLSKSYFDNTSSGPVADPNTPIALYAYDGNAISSGCPVAYPPTLPDSNPIGHRTAMCDGSGGTSWAYDISSGIGWKTTEKRTINGVTNATVSQNNLGGMLYQLTYPSSRMVTYTPTAAGRYASAIDSVTGITYAQKAVYAPPGGLTSLNNSGTNILVTNTYNSRLQPATLSGSSGSGLVLDLIYNFHLGQGDNGNVFGITNNRDASRNQTFTYDMLNRIVTGQDQDTSDGWCWGYNYSVDNWGNRTNETPAKCTGFSMYTPADSAGHNQVSGACYDLAGNYLGWNGCPSLPYAATYTYDAENRIISTAGVTYTYDGDGNRVEKSGGRLYWGSGPLAESDLSGNMQHEYVSFNGKRIARLDLPYQSGTQAYQNAHYYFSDHLGSSNVITDYNGTMKPCPAQYSPVGYTTVATGEEESDFLPYGREMQLCNSVQQNYKFTGKERDAESGLDNFGARYDSSSLGRFMTTDPVVITTERLKNPQQLNLYAYVANNPLRFIDPTGEILQCVGDDKSRSQCFADLQQIAGDAANRLSMDAKTGVVSFDTKDLDLSKNEGASLVNNLVGSKSTYDFSVGPTIMTDKGPVRVDTIGHDLANLPAFGDQRSIGNPPSGVSDILDLFLNNPKIQLGSNTNLKVAPEWTVAFHELAEAFEKIDGGKGGSYEAGHNAALQRELKLRDQRPYLKEYNTGAGGPANSPNPEGKIIIKQ